MEEETLIQGILERAEQEVREIVTKAHEEAKYEMLQVKKEITKEEEKRLSDIKRQIEQQKSNKIEMAELQARNKILAQKQKVIGEIKQEVMQKILTSSDTEYVSLISQMLANANVENTSSYEIILPSKAKSQIETIAKQKGYGIATESADFKTGFILRKGRVEQNYVLDTWFDFNKNSIDKIIADILFRRD